MEYCTDEEDADKGEALNEEWSKSGGSACFTETYLKSLKYDGSLREKVVDATKNAQKPIIFLYGGDDAWTGGALPDECYNGINTFKVILSAQNHSACITAASVDDRNNAWGLIDDALAGKLPSSIAPHAA